MSLVPKNENLPQKAQQRGDLPRPMVSGGSERSTGFSFSGKDFVRMIHRRKWLIILSVVLFSITSVLVTFLWLKYAPLYTARALLAVNPPKTSELRGATNLLNKDIMDRILQSRAQAMQTRTVFQAALDDIRHTNWFADASGEGGDIDIIDELFEEVHIGVVPRTNFISVSMTDMSAGDITDIVNAISEAAVKDYRDISSEERNKTITLVTAALLTQTKNRARDYEDLQAMRKQDSATESTDAPQTLKAKQAELMRMMFEAKTMFNQARQAMKMIEGLTKDDIANLPDIKRAVDMDPKVLQLQQQETNLMIFLDSAKARFGKEHRTILARKSDLKALQSQLTVERKIITDKQVEDTIQARASFYERAKDDFDDLAKQVYDTNQALKDLNVLQEKVASVGRRIETSTKSIEELATRLTDLKLLMLGEQPIVLMRRAQKPHEPSFPKYKILVALGIFLGIAFGLGLSFLLELLDTSIKAPSDISRRVELPMLGMVPHLDDVEEDIPDLRTAFLTSPNTIVCEAFRQIRTTLMFSGPAEQLKSILVTSPMPEDGRTSVSLNLGNHLAIGNKRVLIVDANFRQPAIHQLFPDGPAAGLSNVLVGQANWREILQEIRPGLSVMSSGPIPPNPVELLGSEQMAELVEELTKEFDHVIFDTAPLLVVADAAVLSTRTDGTILVVRAGINTYGIAQRARDTLTKLGTHIYGVVLNGVQIRAGGYLRKSYETFYEYKEGAQSPVGSVASKTLDENPEDENNEGPEETDA